MTKPTLIIQGPGGTSEHSDSPAQEEESPNVFIHIELRPDGQLDVKMKVHTPTQALRMLLFLANKCSEQADEAIRENMAYMEMVNEFNQAAKDGGFKPAPDVPVRPGKVIGSPERPARQTSVARASAAELQNLDRVIEQTKRIQ